MTLNRFLHYLSRLLMVLAFGFTVRGGNWFAAACFGAWLVLPDD